MSNTIAEAIKRLQDIKTNIRTALTNKGVSGASTHNFADFATDIGKISTGTNVSDTTATASDVLSEKYFYTSDGTRTRGRLGIITVYPTGSSSTSAPQYLSSGSNYKPSSSGYFIGGYTEVSPSSDFSSISTGFKQFKGSGYVVSSYSTASASDSGTYVGTGAYKISSGGYLYSEQQKIKTGTITIPAKGSADIYFAGYPEFFAISTVTNRMGIYYDSNRLSGAYVQTYSSNFKQLTLGDTSTTGMYLSAFAFNTGGYYITIYNNYSSSVTGTYVLY